MKVELVRNDIGHAVGWEMSGETPEDLKTLRMIRDLQFWGMDDYVIEYDGRREADDAVGNPGILKWIQRIETSRFKAKQSLDLGDDDMDS